MNIEIKATSAVEGRIADTDYLDPIISEVDKQPSWDGEIIAYKNSNKKKSEIFGRTPVQVKGKLSKDLKAKSITYRMSRVDMENYQKDGGALLFVVYLKESGENKIYYNAMTPYYLNNVLEAQKTNKTIRVGLKELPENNDDLCNMVFNFIRDMRRQSLIKPGKNLTISEIEDLLGRDNIEYGFTYTGIGYDRNNPFSFLSKNDFYMYALSKDKTIAFPIEHIEKVDTMCEDRKCFLSIGDERIEENLRFTQTEGKNIITIGKSLEFVIQDEKMNFKYTLKGNLNERINAIKILISMIENDGLTVNGAWLVFKADEKDKITLDMNAKKNQLDYLTTVKDTFDLLNVKTPLEVDEVTDKQEANLRMLINSIKNGKPATFKEKDIAPVCHFDIGNLRVLLHVKKINDKEYKVEDFFNVDLKCYFDDEGKYLTSPYCILCSEDYNKASNLVLNKVIEDFKRYDNEVHLERLVFCVLELIRAYDNDNDRNDLLNAAIELCDWLESKEQSNVIHIINKLQCVIRTRDLTKEELDILSNITIEQADNSFILAGVHILMNNESLAKKYIEKLSDKDRADFEGYPIYNLLLKKCGDV